MNKYTKISLTVGTLVVLAAVAAQGVFAAGKITYAWAKVTWNAAPGAQMYNIYYKESGDKKWTHAVRSLPSNSTNYTITYLKKGVTYWYNIAAVNANGSEYWLSRVKKLNSSPMPSIK